MAKKIKNSEKNSLKGVVLMIIGIIMFIIGLILQIDGVGIHILLPIYFIAYMIISQGNKIRRGLKKKLFDVPESWS